MVRLRWPPRLSVLGSCEDFKILYQLELRNLSQEQLECLWLVPSNRRLQLKYCKNFTPPWGLGLRFFVSLSRRICAIAFSVRFLINSMSSDSMIRCFEFNELYVSLFVCPWTEHSERWTVVDILYIFGTWLRQLWASLIRLVFISCRRESKPSHLLLPNVAISSSLRAYAGSGLFCLPIVATTISAFRLHNLGGR